MTWLENLNMQELKLWEEVTTCVCSQLWHRKLFCHLSGVRFCEDFNIYTLILETKIIGHMVHFVHEHFGHCK